MREAALGLFRKSGIAEVRYCSHPTRLFTFCFAAFVAVWHFKLEANKMRMQWIHVSLSYWLALLHWIGVLLSALLLFYLTTSSPSHLKNELITILEMSKVGPTQTECDVLTTHMRYTFCPPCLACCLLLISLTRPTSWSWSGIHSLDWFWTRFVWWCISLSA